MKRGIGRNNTNKRIEKGVLHFSFGLSERKIVTQKRGGGKM